MSFSTNIGDKSLGKLVTSMPATATFTWDLNGLQRRLGAIDINATTVRRRPPLLLLPTSIGRSSENSKSARSTKPLSSMDWSIVSVLQSPRISQLDLF